MKKFISICLCCFLLLTTIGVFAVEDDEKQLFEVYQTARYAGLAANEVIDNDLVDRLVQINLKKTQ